MYKKRSKDANFKRLFLQLLLFRLETNTDLKIRFFNFGKNNIY